MNIGTLSIELMANIARLQKDMDSARSIVGNAMTSITGMVDLAKKALIGLAAGISVAAFASLIKGSADATAALHDMSIQTGASVASLMAFRSVAATSETSIQNISGAMNKFAKGMAVANEESKGIGQAVQAIGLDFNKLKAMAPEQQMLTIAQSLENFQDGAGKSAVAMTLFGKQGATMLPFLKDLAEQSDSVAAMLTEQEIATQKAAAALADDFGDNLAKINRAGNEWVRDLTNGMMPALVEVTGEILKAAEGANGFTAALRRAAADGTIAAFTRDLIDGIKKVIAVIEPAAKITAAYFALFVAAPAALVATTAALTPLVHATAVYAMNVAIGQTATIQWNAALFGTSVSAQLAAGSLSKMMLAANVLFAAFAGWEIGTYLRDNFVEARVAGLSFVGVILTGWENVKYGAQMAWEGIKFAWDSTVNGMKSSFADYLSVVAKGLSFVGATDTSKQVEAYADGLRKAAASQGSFAAQTAGITAAHKAAIEAIDKNIVDLVSYELAANKAAKAAKEAAPAVKGLLNYGGDGDAAAKQAQAAYQSLVASIGEKIAANNLELATGQNLSDSQKALIKLDQELGAGKLKLLPKHEAIVRALLAEQGATEGLLAAQRAQQEVTKFVVESTAAREAASAALSIEYAMYGKTADARQVAMVAVKAEADMQKKLDELREKNLPISEQVIAQLKAEREARVLVEQATLGQSKALSYAAQLADENKRFGTEYILDEKARAYAVLAIDNEVWQERIRLAGDGTEAQKRLQEQYTIWYRNQSIKPQLDEQMKMWASVERTAHDTFISIFDSGKSAFDRLRDALKNGLLDLLYQMTLKKWVINISASVGFGGTASMAQSATGIPGGNAGGSDAVSMAQVASSLYNALKSGGGMEQSIANGVQSVFDKMGLSMSSGTPGTAAQFAGKLGGTVGGYMIGSTLNSAISNGYETGSGMQTVQKIATAVASYLGGPLGGAIAGTISGLINRAFGMKEREITGVTLNGAFGPSGFMGSTDTAWKQDGGWFRSDRSGVDKVAIDATIAKEYAAAYDAIKVASADFAKTIGINADAIKDRAQTMSIVLTKDEEANKKAIADFFGGVGDKIASELLPSISSLSKEGESASATLQRVAVHYAALDASLSSIGMTFGMVGAESLSARERLIELSGGMDVLAQNVAGFAQNYLTEAERLKPVADAVTKAMSELGHASVDTRDEFKTLVMGLDLTTEAGAKQYAELMKLQEAFALVYPAIDNTVKAAEAAKEKHELQLQLMEAMGDAEGALALRRKDALDSLLSDEARLLQQQIWAAQQTADAISKAQDAAAKSQQSAADAMRGLGSMFSGIEVRAKEAAAALREYNNALKLGNMSTLSPEQKYLEAKKQFEQADSKNLQAAGQAFLESSKGWFGGSAGYATDFAMVMARGEAERRRADDYLKDLPRIYAEVAASMAGRPSPAQFPENVVFEAPPTPRIAPAQARADTSGARAVELLEQVLGELQADKTQRGAVGTATLEKLDTVTGELAKVKRRLETA